MTAFGSISITAQAELRGAGPPQPPPCPAASGPQRQAAQAGPCPRGSRTGQTPHSLPWKEGCLQAGSPPPSSSGSGEALSSARAGRTERTWHRVHACPSDQLPSSQPLRPRFLEGSCEVHLQVRPQPPPPETPHSLPASPKATGARGFRVGGSLREQVPSREGVLPQMPGRKAWHSPCGQSWEGSEHAQAAPRPAPRRAGPSPQAVQEQPLPGESAG